MTVAYEEGSHSGAAFVSLSLASQQNGKLPNGNHRDLWPRGAPVVYVDYLAVARIRQGGGMGTALLMRSLETAYEVSQLVPVYGVALRSLNDRTTAYYKGLGFQVAPNEGVHPLMLMDIWSINELVESVRGTVSQSSCA